MLNSKMALYLMVLIMLFSSCAKLPISKSQAINSNSENEFETIATSNYDKTNDINYGVARNDTNFYVKAVIHDQQSLMKIMRGGLIFYFDPNGKKGKDYALKIERAERQAIDRNALMGQDMGGRDNRMQNMPLMLNATLTKVTWDANGKEFVFYRGFQKQNIDVQFVSNEFNEVQLLLKMPLNEIPEPTTKLMSVGIATGSVSANSGSRPGGEMGQAGGMSGGRGGGGGGGRGGNMGGGGPGGAGGRPMGGSPGGSSANMSPIQIWFQVEL